PLSLIRLNTNLTGSPTLTLTSLGLYPPSTVISTLFIFDSYFLFNNYFSMKHIHTTGKTIFTCFIGINFYFSVFIFWQHFTNTKDREYNLFQTTRRIFTVKINYRWNSLFKYHCFWRITTVNFNCNFLNIICNISCNSLFFMFSKKPP